MISIQKIDSLIDKFEIARIEADQHIARLKFIREKILHGSEEEKRIILIISEMTIESIEASIQALKEIMKNA